MKQVQVVYEQVSVVGMQCVRVVGVYVLADCWEMYNIADYAYTIELSVRFFLSSPSKIRVLLTILCIFFLFVYFSINMLFQDIS